MNNPAVLDFNVTFGNDKLAQCLSEERRKKGARQQNLRIKQLSAYHNTGRNNLPRPQDAEATEPRDPTSECSITLESTDVERSTLQKGQQRQRASNKPRTQEKNPIPEVFQPRNFIRRKQAQSCMAKKIRQFEMEAEGSQAPGRYDGASRAALSVNKIKKYRSLENEQKLPALSLAPKQDNCRFMEMLTFMKKIPQKINSAGRISVASSSIASGINRMRKIYSNNTIQ